MKTGELQRSRISFKCRYVKSIPAQKRCHLCKQSAVSVWDSQLLPQGLQHQEIILLAGAQHLFNCFNRLFLIWFNSASKFIFLWFILQRRITVSLPPPSFSCLDPAVIFCYLVWCVHYPSRCQIHTLPNYSFQNRTKLLIAAVLSLMIIRLNSADCVSN